VEGDDIRTDEGFQNYSEIQNQGEINNNDNDDENVQETQNNEVKISSIMK
jgi:hypothetical protein